MEQGVILRCDQNFATLHGFQSSSDVEGVNLQKLIPSLILPDPRSGDLLPKDVRKQRSTGRTRDGATFPLSLLIAPCPHQNDGDQDPALLRHHHRLKLRSDSALTQDSGTCSPDFRPLCYTGSVWVFANISGMLTLHPDGTIHSCNHYFALMLFGYSQQQLVGKDISQLIPSFYDDQEFLDSDYPNFEDDGVPVGDEGCESEQLKNGLTYQLAVDIHNFANQALKDADSSIPEPMSHECIRTTEGCDNFSKNSGKYITTGKCGLDSKKSNLNENDVNGNPANIWEKSTLCLRRGSSGFCNSKRQPNESNTCCIKNGNNKKARNQYSSSSEGSGDDSKMSDPPDHSPPPPDTILEYPPDFEDEDEDDVDNVDKMEYLMSQLGLSSNKTVAASPVTCWQQDELPSTPSSTLPILYEGSYFGLGRHNDGSDLPIVYQVRKAQLEDGQILYCVWVSRDPEEPGEGSPTQGSLTLASSVNSIADDTSLGQAINEKAQLTHDSGAAELELVGGEYKEHYVTLQQIGKGAFGFVRMAYRMKDKRLVVTKFIRKAKVYKDCWVYDNILQHQVPLEVSLLTTLNHPNIVKILDVYENDQYFQLVMEKCGCGMDLFEFIDRGPSLDEPLASYIFRQIVSAVTYLHSLNILHRDIKDENIIIDENFHIKLIDFGSATFLTPGKEFASFCGTVEYCSPEVLQGKNYRGPELEVWSLGVTLYTLVYGENPFYDVEETIKGELHPPFKVSNELMALMKFMLHKEPNERCTLRDLATNTWLHQPIDLSQYRFQDVVPCSAEECNPPSYFDDIIECNLKV